MFNPGQKVITSDGTIKVIAYVDEKGIVYAYDRGLPVVVKPRGDAWGGEHDCEAGLSLAA